MGSMVGRLAKRGGERVRDRREKGNEMEDIRDKLGVEKYVRLLLCVYVCVSVSKAVSKQVRMLV